MADWVTFPLAEVLDFQEGPGILAKDFRPEGVPLIRLAGVKRGANILTGANHLDPTMVERRWSHFRLKRGDVILSTSASLGEVAVVGEEGVDSIAYTGLIRFRPRDERVSARFIPVALGSASFQRQVESMGSGSVLRHFGPSHLKEMTLELPPPDVQERIADVVGVIDDKIDSNRRLRTLLRELGRAQFNALLEGGESLSLTELTTSIARGVAPKYNDSDVGSPLVLNQKCVRDGWVTTSRARRMVDRSVAIAKKAEPGDILVNSTGTGTLGRVGRWHEGSIFADGHVSIVKPDPAKIGPTVLAYSMFGREADIEAMATGSTGQTELSPTRLGSLVVEVPEKSQVQTLEQELFAIEERSHATFAEEQMLTSLRDALLPELLSGRIRVPETQVAFA